MKISKNALFVSCFIFYSSSFAQDADKRDKCETMATEITLDLQEAIFKNRMSGKGFEKEIDEAIGKYREILKAELDCFYAQINLAKAYGLKKNYKKADENFRAVVNKMQKNAIKDKEIFFKQDAYREWGFMYELSGMEDIKGYDIAKRIYNEALHDFSKMLKKYPDNVMIQRSIEEFKNLKKQVFNEQSERIKEIKQQKGEVLSADLYFKILELCEAADAFYWKGNYEQSIEFYEKALKTKLGIEQMSPEGFYLPIPSIYESMGNVYKKWGKYKKAIKFYEKQLTLHPEEMPELLYSRIGLMECYFAVKNFDQVKTECEIILKMDPENKRAKKYLEEIKKAEKQN